MVGLADRVAWAIDTIKWDDALDRGIKDVELARILKTNKDTLATYRKRKGLTKGAVLEQLVAHYNFSPEWLFKGIGEPFPGARLRYPDVCGPELQQDAHSIKEAPARFDVMPLKESLTVLSSGDVDPAVRAMAEIKDIFAYGDEVIILALQANLVAFKRAARREHENIELRREVDDLKASNARMQIQFANLQAAVKKLQEKSGKPADGKIEENDNVAKDVAV